MMMMMTLCIRYKAQLAAAYSDLRERERFLFSSASQKKGKAAENPSVERYITQ
jgi:hypothetical protein